jgi:hypothetical protein
VVGLRVTPPRGGHGVPPLQIYFANPKDAARLSFKMKLKSWIKTLGFWGFMFFLIKGLLWLSIPVLIALFAE